MGLPENAELYESLDKKKKEDVINFLKNYLPASDKILIRKEIAKDQKWFCDYHHIWGMTIRNLLRNNGYGELFWPVQNLDDIYVELIEDAVK